tara:strand:- start:434 stop:1093 length:660 start_codon:yes stop_codon:yes gene_type:complete
MDQEQFKKILDESGKRPQWLLEHLTSSGSWRPIIYNIGQEKLLSQVDNSNRRYAVFIKKKQEEQPDKELIDLRREFIKEEWLRPQLNDYFYKRKRDLDQVVYSMLRLNDIGLAEELYLRLKNEECEIPELAFEYSLGPEKYTKGIVGPMPLSKANEQIRAISTKENIGNLNKPVVIQKTIVIAIVEHIIEAILTPEMEEKLLDELFNIELQKTVNAITG